jgi:hypothetical protein
MEGACANKSDFRWKICGRRMIPESGGNLCVNYNNVATHMSKTSRYHSMLENSGATDVILVTANKLSMYSDKTGEETGVGVSGCWKPVQMHLFSVCPQDSGGGGKQVCSLPYTLVPVRKSIAFTAHACN